MGLLNRILGALLDATGWGWVFWLYVRTVPRGAFGEGADCGEGEPF